MNALLAALLLALATHAYALEWQDSPEVAKLFADAGVHGTFTVYDGRRLTGHNRARAEQRFVPASTFKIPNSLIGLATGAVKSTSETLPYGGNPQPVKAWEQDMNLRDAIGISNVPIYQELARRIGLQRMRAGVASLDYGNKDIGAIVDTFWLAGPLKISAIEQARFLARLARDELPLEKSVQAEVRAIVHLESQTGWILYGKTGWATSTQPGVGWWVGWVENRQGLHAFALNMDMPTIDGAPRRIELGKASLKALGILP